MEWVRTINEIYNHHWKPRVVAVWAWGQGSTKTIHAVEGGNSEWLVGEGVFVGRISGCQFLQIYIYIFETGWNWANTVLCELVETVRLFGTAAGIACGTCGNIIQRWWVSAARTCFNSTQMDSKYPNRVLYLQMRKKLDKHISPSVLMFPEIPTKYFRPLTKISSSSYHPVACGGLRKAGMFNLSESPKKPGL